MRAPAGAPAPDAVAAPHRLLVVEDDEEMAALLGSSLRREGYLVDVLTDGAQVLRRVARREYSAIVLDVLLPGSTGFEICSALRQRGRWVPVLMLTALGSTEDRVEGLQVGADDYLTKPFELAELTARIHALLRLHHASEAQVLRCGELSLEVATRRCFAGEQEVTLTPRELDVLSALLRRPGIVLTRRTLLDEVWGGSGRVNPNVVDQTIAHLRAKVGRDLLQTVYGVGYRAVDPPPG